jgi:hypothetical protein
MTVLAVVHLAPEQTEESHLAHIHAMRKEHYSMTYMAIAAEGIPLGRVFTFSVNEGGRRSM